MGRISRTVTISLPPRLYEEVERLAKQENKTRSELFRDMIKVYEEYLDEKRLLRLRRLGKETASRYGIRSEDDIVKLVHEARGIRD